MIKLNVNLINTLDHPAFTAFETEVCAYVCLCQNDIPTSQF